MTSANLRRSLSDFRLRLETLTQERRQQRLIRMRDQTDVDGMQMRQFAMSADLRVLMDRLAAAVTLDINRYAPPVKPDPAAAPPAPPHAESPLGPYVQDFSRHLMPTLVPHVNSTQMADPADTYFAHLFHDELVDLNDEGGLVAYIGSATLPKLKKAYEAFLTSRPGDAMTILRTAQRNDPHNHILAFLMSQLLYHHAARGQQDALPEARELAQRTLIFSDKLPADKLAAYQYHAIAAERYFGTDRMMGWLRESNLLKLEPLTGKHGLLGHRGVHLRSWHLLSTLPFNVWGDDELNALKALVNEIVGGGMLYIAMFRQMLVTESNLRKEPIAIVSAIEEQVQEAYRHYMTLAPSMHQLPITTSRVPWLVRNRYLNTMATHVHPPGFDHILLHVALSGSSWHTGIYPDAELRAALDDPNLSYWRIWTQAISPTRETHHDHVLPVNDALDEAQLMADCDKLYEELQQAEAEKIKPDVWDMIRPWMVRWNMDHLLAAGTGTTKPRVKFAPTLSPFNTYYRRWGDPMPTGVLSSEMIADAARRGSFGNLFEVLAAFEGAARLLDDPIHGLMALQKRALNAAKQQEPERFGALKIDDSGPNMAIMLLPLGLLAGMAAAVALSKNWGQAIGLMLVISGVAGLASVSLTRK